MSFQRPTVIKFFPATPAIGSIIGRGGSNLRSIGRELNGNGDRVTIKFNEPNGKTPGQFCIISNASSQADTAYTELRKLEEDFIANWWSKALSKETGEDSIKYSHQVIKSLAGLVLGKESSNLKTAREDFDGVDIQVSNPDEKSCVITYEVALEKADDAFKALQQLRKIEREAFSSSQTRCLNSSTRVKSEPISDGLDEQILITIE